MLSVSREVGVVNQIEYLGRSYAGEDVSSYHILKFGEIVYTKSPLYSNPYGIIQCNRYKTGIVSTMYAVYKVKNGINPVYVEKYFGLDTRLNNYLRPLVNKGAKNDMKINNEDVLNGFFAYPTIDEQNKIVNFLDLIQRKIDILESKISILKKYKKGIKKIVVKDSVKYWKNTSLNGINLMNFLVEIKEYNENDGAYVHVTLSKEGISTKTERYDRDFLVKSDDKKYRITRSGQLCYNPANLKFGVICLNNYSTGIFSPIYVTFKIKNIVPEYLELIVTSNDFINYSMRYQQGTVYERMSVSVEDFLKIKISPMDIKEQLKYAKISYCIDKKISKLDNELMILQKFKNNLLNKLFI